MLKELKTKPFFQITKLALSNYVDDKGPRLGAALAYYTIFSLAPLLVLVVAIAGLAFGEEAVSGRLVEQLRGLLGDQGGAVIQTIVAGAHHPSTNILATIVGVVTLLFGASGVFGELQDSLNTIWNVKPKPGRTIRRLLRDRFLSFAMILGSGFLLLVSLVVSAALSAVGDYLSGREPQLVLMWHGVNIVVSFVVIAGLFAVIFKALPDVKIHWRHVWVGAVVSALLFTLGKYLIGLYLGHSTVASVYGASGSVIIILLWAYYSSQVLFLGAELSRAQAEISRARIEPEENAVPLQPEERVEQGLKPRNDPRLAHQG